MQSLFISPSNIQSPRWLEAFSLAPVLNAERELPADLGDTLIWVVLGDEFNFTHVARWSAAGARVVALATFEDPAQAKQALEAGANGYLHYLAAAPVLQQVMQVVEVGGLWLGVELMRQLVFSTAKILNPTSQNSSHDVVSLGASAQTYYLDLLSARERDVAKAVAAGKSNKEVAKELDITERTVKAHLSAVFDKLKVRDRLHLVLVLSGRQ
jgi:DNA-binding NarL/FixJ family response regulator